MGSQLIGPSGQTVPNQFGPHGQMVPQNLFPMDKWSPTNLVSVDKWSIEYSVCPGGQALGIQKYKDRIGWGPFVQRDQFYGIICPGEQEVGDRKSGDQMGSGPNGSQLAFLQFSMNFTIGSPRTILILGNQKYWDSLYELSIRIL